MEGLVLEVLEPDERSPSRVKLEEFPVTIGRAVDNTVVLDDPEVSAHHAVIERADDGKLVLRDAGSANGLYDLRSKKKVSEVTLSARQKLRLGGTTLKVRAASEPLERTVISRLTVLPDDSIFRRRWLFAVLAPVVAAAFVTKDYLSHYRYVEAARLVFAAVALLIAVVVWSGIWALLSKQLRRRFHFFEHGSVVCVAILALASAALIESYVLFSAPWPVLGKLFYGAALAAVLGWLTYKHLGYCSVWNPRRLQLVSALVALVLVGTGQLYTMANAPKFQAQPEFPETMKPPGLRLGRAQTVDEFFAGARKLQPAADEAARRD